MLSAFAVDRERPVMDFSSCGVCLLLFLGKSS